METLNAWAEVWAGFMWDRTLDSALALFLVGMVWLAFRRLLPAQFGYCLFLLVLLKLVLPSQFSLPSLIEQWIPGPERWVSSTSGTGGGWWWLMGEAQGEESPAAQPNGLDPASSTGPKPEAALTGLSVLMLIWVAAVFLLLLRYAWCQWSTHRRLRLTKPVKLSTFPVDLEELIRISGVKRPIRWREAPWITSPIVVGLFRPAILLPADLNKHFTRNQIKWILLHELAHIRRGDSLIRILQGLLQIIFFFNPVVYIANLAIDQQREFACDDKALIGAKVSRKDCGEGFLNAVVNTNGLPAFLPASIGLFISKTYIQKRLLRILDSKRILQSGLTFRAGLFLLLVMILVLPFGGRMAIAQMGAWIMAEDDPTSRPSPRVVHGMAYDSVRGVVVLHGGVSTFMTPIKDTWEWDGETQIWTEVSTEGPVLYAFGMAYDPGRRVMVLSGGSHGPTYPDAETWEWDGLDWKQVAVEEHPILGCAMAYHPLRKTIIRHGGFIDNMYTTSAETREWDGRQWKLLPDGPPLEGRMVYDSRRNRIVFWGGLAGLGSVANETWEFDGEAWIHAADTGPEGRLAPGLAFDSEREVTVLFGGGLTTDCGFSENRSYNDMWEWDGKKWTFINYIDGPPGQNLHLHMVYDVKNNHIVLFGGAENPDSFRPNDTWLFRFASGILKNIWLNY
ncbi:MAG: M56 family metallopeptidase [bacterium]